MMLWGERRTLAYVQDGVFYCPSCAEYVGATVPARNPRTDHTLSSCHRCTARIVLVPDVLASVIVT